MLTCLVSGPHGYLLATRTANHTTALVLASSTLPRYASLGDGWGFPGSGEGRRHRALHRGTYFCFGLLGQHEGKAARLEQWERPPMPDSSLGSLGGLLEAACRGGMATEDKMRYTIHHLIPGGCLVLIIER